MAVGVGRRMDSGEEVSFCYCPEVFTNIIDLEHAKRVILTKEGALSSELRWDVETKFTIDTLLSLAAIDAQSLVLDYGCGVGRLAKALIERVGCSVVGVDMSPRMRSLAIDYVGSPRFSVYASEQIVDMRFDYAVAAWVLQHCLRPDMDVDLIARVLKPEARFLVLEGFSRCVPVTVSGKLDEGVLWMRDDANVRELILRHFELVQLGSFAPAELQALNDGTYWAVFRKAE